MRNKNRISSSWLREPVFIIPDRTYCEDEETRRDWEERTANNPDDTALHTLHALWIGLCAKVTRNEFTTDQADEVFE